MYATRETRFRALQDGKGGECMKRLVILPLLFALFTVPAVPQSTFLELGLHWGNYSGPAVENVTTVMNRSGPRVTNRYRLFFILIRTVVARQSAITESS